MLLSRLGRVIPASKGVMRSYDDLNSYAKTVSLCGLYAVGARTRVWKGRIKGGLMAVSLFIVTPIQYVPVTMLNWGARYGWSSTREASKGTKSKMPYGV